MFFSTSRAQFAVKAPSSAADVCPVIDRARS
jgi:hypothetical protein